MAIGRKRSSKPGFRHTRKADSGIESSSATLCYFVHDDGRVEAKVVSHVKRTSYQELKQQLGVNVPPLS